MDLKRVLASAPRRHDVGKPRPLLTPWGEGLDPASVRAEHPRPQFARERFTLLNGWWDYAIMPMGARRTLTPPDSFDGRILVPFSPEALLSGVGRTLQPDEILWYVRRVTVDVLRPGERCLLHFEAVDFACACCVNGQVVGTHEGGYLPFSFDITDALTRGAASREAGEAGALAGAYGCQAVVALCVWDPSDTGTQLRGKQTLDPGGIWYSAQSGIWQPVWLEVVPERRIGALALHPDLRAEQLVLDVDVNDGEGLVRVYVATPEGSPVASAAVLAREGTALCADGPSALSSASDSVELSSCGRRVRVTVPIPELRPWSPDDPYLYTVTVRFGADAVRSYTAFRTVEVRRDESGMSRFFLNGQPLLLRGVLDQGYWSDGLMTAPADEALVHDIAAMKDVGFNMLRKHLKVEADRWYYHCDRLGMLVWQDMVSGGGPLSSWETSYKPTLFRRSWGNYRDDTPAHQEKLGAADERYQHQWTEACRETVAHLRNHPSVVTWVLFNEAWGQFDALAAAEMVHDLDPTRPLDSVSGWYDQHGGDFLSVHNYFRPLEVYRDDPRKLQGYAAEKGGRAFALSEFGGAVYRVEGHSAFAESYGYDVFDDLPSWREAVRAQLEAATALEGEGLSCFVYTQLSDVEEEVNGLLTYDRRVNKLKEGSYGDDFSG